MREYVHFGTDRFDPDHNMSRATSNKPSGFWASPVDSEYGWRDFVIHGMPERIDGVVNAPYIVFHLKEGARVLDVRKPEDIEGYITADRKIDFEKIKKDYDALELHLDGEHYEELHWGHFYGWDCDSIVIWNPDCIIEDRDKKIERTPEYLLDVIRARSSTFMMEGGGYFKLLRDNPKLKRVLKDVLDLAYKSARNFDHIDPESSDTILEKIGTDVKELKEFDISVSFERSQRHRGDVKKIALNKYCRLSSIKEDFEDIFEIIKGIHSHQPGYISAEDLEAAKSISEVAKQIGKSDIPIDVLLEHLEKARGLLCKYPEVFEDLLYIPEKFDHSIELVKQFQHEGFVMADTGSEAAEQEKKPNISITESALERENIRLKEILKKALETTYSNLSEAERIGIAEHKDVKELRKLAAEAESLGAGIDPLKRSKNARVILANTNAAAEMAGSQYHFRAAVGTRYPVKGMETIVRRRNRQAGIPSPCNVPLKVIEGDGYAILVSDMNLSTIGGIMALKGEKPKDAAFWESVEYLETVGLSRIGDLPEPIQEKFCAYCAFERSLHQEPVVTGLIMPVDVTSAVAKREEAVKIILDEDHPQHSAYMEAGRRMMFATKKNDRIGKAAEEVFAKKMPAGSGPMPSGESLNSKMDSARQKSAQAGRGSSRASKKTPGQKKEGIGI